jgi:hypothetical protein
LGALAANDLFWRTLADVPWRRLPDAVDFLAGSALVSIIVTTLTDMVGIFKLVGLFAQWLLAAYLVFAVTPRIYLGTATNITDDNRFRLLTAGISVGFAVSLWTTLTLTSEWWSLSIGVLLGVLIGSMLFGTFLDRVHQWNQLTPNGRVNLLNAFIPVSDVDRRDLLDGFTAGGVRSRFAVFVWKGALVLLCVLPCFLLGIFIVFAFSLYPLLEVAVLTGIALDRWSGPVAGRLPSERLTGLESRLYDTVSYAGRGVKGMTTMFLVMVGLLLPVLLFATIFPIWIDQITFWVAMLRTPGPFIFNQTVGFIFWNQTGVFVCLLLSVGFQLWFWLRMLDRLPHFLDQWERRHNLRAAYRTNDEEVEDTSSNRQTHRTSRPLTRPVGYLVPAVVILVPAIVFIYHDPYPVNEPLPIELHRLFAYSWPVVVAILAVCVGLTVRRKSQPIWAERFALPVSLMIQAGSLFALTSISQTPEPGALQVGAVWLAPRSMTALVMLAVPWIFFYEDVALSARRSSGVRQYMDIAYLLSFGGITYLLSMPESGMSAVLFSGIAMVSFVGGIIMGVSRYFYK